MSSSIDAKARAEASFKRKQEQVQQGAKAWQEYQAEGRAAVEKTERLRALRLAKEASEGAAEKERAAKPSRKPVAALHR
jgi:hypothetical protein